MISAKVMIERIYIVCEKMAIFRKSKRFSFFRHHLLSFRFL